MSIAHDDAFAHQVIVNVYGIRHPHQEEVGIGRENLLHTMQGGKLAFQTIALLLQYFHPTLHLIMPVQHLHGLLLRQLVDVIGIFDFVEDADDVGRGKSHAQADGGTSPSLGESLQNDQVGKFIQVRQERRFFRKIVVRFVHNDQAIESVQQFHDFIPVQVIAGRIIGCAEEHGFRMFIGCLQHLLGRELEVLVQQNFAVLHIIDFRSHQIHAIRRLNGHDIVHPWLAKCPKHQVDGFVAAVAQEDMFRSHSFQFGEIFLQLPLHGVGITVVWIIVWILVGIQENRCRYPLVFIACRRVRLQLPDVRACQFL